MVAEEKLAAATGKRDKSRRLTEALATEATGTAKCPVGCMAAEALEKEAAPVATRIRVRRVTEALEEDFAAAPRDPITG